MFRFLSWKTLRLLRIFKEKGGNYALDFFLKKASQKAQHSVAFIFRKSQADHLRKEFTSLWLKNSKANHPKRVLLLVSSFFDFDGQTFMQGGAERYIFELNKIINSLGGELEVYQCAHSNWHRTIQNLSVYGINTNGNNHRVLNQSFHKWVPKGCLTIYFQMQLSTPHYHTPSICVSHGIDWDAHWLQSNKKEYRNTIQSVLSSIDHVNQLISVDTNLINWIRATDVSLSQKCLYLPNFVDIQQFQPVAHADGKIIILYPRRLSEARGFWLLVAIIPKLLEEHANIQFHFCGIAESFEKVEISKLCELYTDKVLWYDVPPDQMPVVYQKADLVVIPTLYSEGTSLSCLEALASRRAVIATNVGGLTDIILPGFNGLLIEPNKEALYASINTLINNRKLRETLASNGYQTVQVFDISRWKDKWTSIMKPYLVFSDAQRSKKTK